MGKSKIEVGSWEREQFVQIRWTQQAFSEKDGEYHAAENWETKGFDKLEEALDQGHL